MVDTLRQPYTGNKWDRRNLDALCCGGFGAWEIPGCRLRAPREMASRRARGTCAGVLVIALTLLSGATAAQTMPDEKDA